MRKILVPLLSGFIIYGCTSTNTVYRETGIDQEPMYGGIDRAVIPELNSADEKFIKESTRKFGAREIASQHFFEQGVRYYKMDNYSMAMKYFNQAWLLNPSNPDAFWGFAILYHDEGKQSICKAKDMMEKAIDLNLSNPIAFADGGRIFTLYAVTNLNSDQAAKQEYIDKSEELFQIAATLAPNSGYVYGTWATAYYWRDDYTKSWEMVDKANSLGFVFRGPFIKLLTSKQPRPD